MILFGPGRAYGMLLLSGASHPCFSPIWLWHWQHCAPSMWRLYRRLNNPYFYFYLTWPGSAFQSFANNFGADCPYHRWPRKEFS